MSAQDRDDDRPTQSNPHPPSDAIAAASSPDDVNTEQEDESTQAQTLADEALGRATGMFGIDDSEKVKTGDETDDVQDLVDHMHQMETSGRIDMSAFQGERNDDEEEGRYGSAADEE